MKAVALVFLAAAGATVPTFEPVQPDPLGAGGSFVNAFADYDGDGDPDLFVGFNGTANRLYRNDAGTLTDVAAAAGLADARATRAAAWGDFDADGDSDLLVGFAPGAGAVLRLYRNHKGQFADATAEAGLTADTGAVRQPAWVDVDADGDLDLFIAFRDRANAFYRNDAGRWTTSARCRRTTACSGRTSTATVMRTSRSPAHAPTVCTRCSAMAFQRQMRGGRSA